MFMRLLKTIKKIFFHGLFTIFPITATIVIAHFGYTLIARWVAPLRLYVPAALQHIPGIEFGLVLGFIFLVGALLRFLILGPVVHHLEKIITRIPLIRIIYSSSKILVDFFNVPNPTTAEKTVVLVQFPHKGTYCIAFLLESAENSFQRLLPGNQKKYYKVFMPNSPNPTSGFFMLMHRDDIIDTDISFEDAIKTIVSCGIHTPEALGGNTMPADAEPAELDEQ